MSDVWSGKGFHRLTYNFIVYNLQTINYRLTTKEIAKQSNSIKPKKGPPTQ